jgi:hypothetical protein
MVKPPKPAAKPLRNSMFSSPKTVVGFTE